MLIGFSRLSKKILASKLSTPNSAPWLRAVAHDKTAPLPPHVDTQRCEHNASAAYALIGICQKNGELVWLRGGGVTRDEAGAAALDAGRPLEEA